MKLISKTIKIIDYDSFKNIAKHFLDVNNITELSNKRIEELEQRFKKDLVNWNKYKSEVLFDWDFSHREWTQSYIRLINKLIKKYKVVLNYEQKWYINSLPAKEFTTHRSIKVIEAPFIKDKEYYDSGANAHFKNVKLYKISKKEDIKNIFDGDLYLLKNRIVFWNNKLKEVVLEIKSKDIKIINQRNSGVIIELNNKYKYLMKYKDDDIIIIFFRRLFVNTEIKKEEIRNYKSTLKDKIIPI